MSLGGEGIAGCPNYLEVDSGMKSEMSAWTLACVPKNIISAGSSFGIAVQSGDTSITKLAINAQFQRENPPTGSRVSHLLHVLCLPLILLIYHICCLRNGEVVMMTKLKITF